jgi:hypothetical protein
MRTAEYRKERRLKNCRKIGAARSAARPKISLKKWASLNLVFLIIKPPPEFIHLYRAPEALLEFVLILCAGGAIGEIARGEAPQHGAQPREC